MGREFVTFSIALSVSANLATSVLKNCVVGHAAGIYARSVAKCTNAKPAEWMPANNIRSNAAGTIRVMTGDYLEAFIPTVLLTHDDIIRANQLIYYIIQVCCLFRTLFTMHPSQYHYINQMDTTTQVCTEGGCTKQRCLGDVARIFRMHLPF